MQTDYPIQKSETNLFFQIYARFFKTNNPADVKIPLRQLITQEHGRGLWGLISNDNDTYLDETFYLQIYRPQPFQLNKEKSQSLIEGFFKAQFISNQEDNASIQQCVALATNICIVGISNSGKQVIGAINFLHFQEGIWINWLATSSILFNKQKWGDLWVMINPLGKEG